VIGQQYAKDGARSIPYPGRNTDGEAWWMLWKR
jgi:hypothetical protein